MMRVLKPLQDKATIGAGKSLVLPEARRVRFLIRGEGPVSAGVVTIECCPESTKTGKFWMELATIPVPADNGLAQYYTEEASGLFRARISRPVSNGTVTVTPLVSRGSPRPAGPDKGCMTPARDELLGAPKKHHHSLKSPASSCVSITTKKPHNS
jgi:hypothetical protein